MTDITDIISYYANLLIVQYHNKPKAQATIRLFAQELMISSLLLSVQDAYDIDTAVGVQLDVIGKYAGVDRYYSELNLVNYFSLETYDETAPTSPPRFGFSTYATYDDYSYNGTLVYDDVITSNNALFDNDYRLLIKLKIILNNSNFSYQQIDDAMFNSFGTAIRRETLSRMAMVYFIDTAITPLIQAILFKQLLPRPMGVSVLVVDAVTGPMFAMTDYSGYQSPFGHGFTTYADYAATPGQVLTYDQIIEG